MVSTDEIRTLATKLKAAGVATSIMDAMEKAKDILINSEKTLQNMEDYNKRVKQDEEDLMRVDNDIAQIDEDISRDDDLIKKELADIEELDEEIKNEEQMLPSEESETLDREGKNEIESSIHTITDSNNYAMPEKDVPSVPLKSSSSDLFEGKTLDELYSEDAHKEQKTRQSNELIQDIEGSNSFDNKNLASQENDMPQDIEGANSFDEAPDNQLFPKNEIVEDIEGKDILGEPISSKKNGVIEDIEGANNNEVKIEEEPVLTGDEGIEDIEGADTIEGNTEDEVLVSKDETTQDVEGANNYEDIAGEKISADDISEYVPEHVTKENIIFPHKNKETIREDMDDLIEDGTKETDDDRRI